MTTPNYTTRQFTIPASGSVELYREADFVTCLSGTGEFKIKIDNGPAFDFEAGLSVVFEQPFTRLELIDVTGAPNVVKIALGKGGVKDARLVLSGLVDTKQVVSDVLTTGAAVSATNAAATLVAAANANRREVILINDGAGKIYVGGDAAAVAGEGLPLVAGQSITLDTTAAIYARNDSGAAVNVAVAEFEVTP